MKQRPEWKWVWQRRSTVVALERPRRRQRRHLPPACRQTGHTKDAPQPATCNLRMGLIKLRIARQQRQLGGRGAYSLPRPSSPSSRLLVAFNLCVLYVARHRTHTYTHTHSRVAARSRCLAVWHATPICRWPGLSTPL